MLKSIDILIGLSVVMLVASMAVTVMTGFVTHIGNTRGRNLRQGLSDLLLLLDPKLKDYAIAIAKAILEHPLIRSAEGRMGDVIHREELTKILMELAGGTAAHQLKPEVASVLKTVLADHGIANPNATLDAIRTLSLQLEKSNPELSNMARANLAILHEAESSLIAKINATFDQTIDRVSHRFTVSTRGITFVCGLLLAVALQVDTVSIVNRISVDEALRESLAKQAVSQQALASSTGKSGPGIYNDVIAQGVISIPKYPDDLKRFADIQHLLGIIFTTLLLSLGAPFWYGALSQLVQFRSKVTQDDDAQRKRRQSTQGVEMTSAGPAPVFPGCSPAVIPVTTRSSRRLPRKRRRAEIAPAFPNTDQGTRPYGPSKIPSSSTIHVLPDPVVSYSRRPIRIPPEVYSCETLRRSFVSQNDQSGSNRRNFVKTLGIAGAAGTALAGPRASAECLTDMDYLQFALNLEYLEAEFYTVATTGMTIDKLGIDISGPGMGVTTGGAKVTFTPSPVYTK